MFEAGDAILAHKEAVFILEIEAIWALLDERTTYQRLEGGRTYRDNLPTEHLSKCEDLDIARPDAPARGCLYWRRRALGQDIPPIDCKR